GQSCSLVVDFKSNVVAKGIAYEELGPETKLHNVPLGQYNSHVVVGKILEGKEQALLPVPVGDKLKFVEDAIGSHDKIGQPSKSKGEKTKSAGHSKGSDLCTSFGAMIGTIIQSGRLKFPYGQELFGDNIEFSYIETNDVKDVCNLESVESPCMVAYMRDGYLFVNPTVFSVVDSKEKTKLVLDRSREANMNEIVFIPYNPCFHWIVIVIDLSSMDVYWLDSIYMRKTRDTRNKITIRYQKSSPSPESREDHITLLAGTFGNFFGSRRALSRACTALAIHTTTLSSRAYSLEKIVHTFLKRRNRALCNKTVNNVVFMQCALCET
ncbi:hypothetical protein IFM89_022738, partial [Coptis chinensis]